ncbi:hypothetical protein E0493_22765 [Roseomonas sp. M0104]|uniref:Uncharacterized protein n=1 Tax=Teichococcus coralli TaxID=2545983 RepID=A0A845BJB5_9PROT|nr:hypothetical protein [Pseudoroseomonas coralli]MXP66154.1 hypothetical protein [Pseudoroseomonas coralli]
MNTYISPPVEPDETLLALAKALALSLVPRTPEANSLVEHVFNQVVALEAPDRERQRRSGLAPLRRAVGALVGGALRCWAGAVPSYVYQPVSPNTFSGLSVSYRHFASARDALVALGYIGMTPGIRFPAADFGDGPIWAGRASRFWPTDKLLKLAEAHGLPAGAVKQAFKADPPRTPPKIPELVELRDFSQRKNGQKVQGRPLPINPNDPVYQKIKRETEAHNAYAETIEVTGCIPPRWYRVFTADWRLQARWYAAGNDKTAAYLTMHEEDRINDIHINGESVVEVDVSSSQLAILHGLLGKPLPDGDLYDVVPGTDRKIVKLWMTISLGRGKMLSTWSRDTAEKIKKACDPHAIHAGMLRTYPFLAEMSSIIPDDLRAAYGTHMDRLVSLYLQGIEARAISGAIAYVRAAGHLALPTHDGLIVPASAEKAAKAGLEGSYRHVAKIIPRLEVERPSRGS